MSDPTSTSSPPRAAPLPRGVWIGAGAAALTIAGIAGALTLRGDPDEAAARAQAGVAAVEAPVAVATPRPVTKPAAPKAEAQAPVCASCGTVVSVQAVKQEGQGTGLGAVAGGVIGGVVGNQIGGGNGRKAMTVLGAVGGGVAGHEIEKQARATLIYNVRVRLDDGTHRTLQLQRAPAVGARVQVDGATLRAV